MQHLTKNITPEQILLYIDEGEMAGMDLVWDKDEWAFEKSSSLAKQVFDLRVELAQWSLEGVRINAAREEFFLTEGWAEESAQAQSDHEVNRSQADWYLDHEESELAWYLGWTRRSSFFLQTGYARREDSERVVRENVSAMNESIETAEEKLCKVIIEYEESRMELDQERAQILEVEREKAERAQEKARREKGLTYMRVRNALILLKRDVGVVRDCLIS
jgi:hypothetical protein